MDTPIVKPNLLSIKAAVASVKKLDSRQINNMFYQIALDFTYDELCGFFPEVQKIAELTTQEYEDEQQ